MVWLRQSHYHMDALRKEIGLLPFLNLIKFWIKFPTKTTGHLFIVDIKFSNVNPKTLLFIELYALIFEKNKKMEPYERSTLQLLSIMVRNEGKDKINSFPTIPKLTRHLKRKNM